MSPLTEPTKLVLKSYGTPGAIAGVAPTLDYRFALDRNEIDAATLTDKLTVTRAATAAVNGSTGYLQLAGPNVARFDHNLTTHQSLGLLVEEARTNLLKYSEAFNNSYWTSYTNVTPNTDTAPDGTLAADTYSSTGAQIETFFIQITPNTDYTSSIYIKKTTGRTYTPGLTLYYDAGVQYGILLNTNDGTTSATAYALPTVAVDSVGNFWRISLTANSGSTTNVRVVMYPNMNAATAIAPGQQVIWGAQLEAGSTASTYIPTTNSAVPRTESATIDGTGVITGTYTMVEKPAGCAVVNGANIDLQTGYTAERVMVFPAALSGAQITAIRSAM